ncbi:H(2)/formate:CoB-CoM heterodisulfide,ferredoxin reductase subunit B2 [Candidatus Lokiarchaeum ossiferum]|uniref:H(2)/formate:CoB-CoM heterodisulfide,ferredoxin reductase subunit B2 n=1 Tax=Candidatus Lokiarchaeum ossiferum TaxID=2951803 RepID=A0ABY6HTC9_9ARCH|nr:H(2)/formate:CoB-CoM heterodisulfide,ferredoxin reductase subunit B2 [Candidatus Lokiarchaeum sp. B-35]
MAEQKAFALYLGCLAPHRYPQIEKATRFLLEKMGYRIAEMERAACCPAPGVLRSFNKFDWMVAGARNICIAEKQGVDLITVCNGCFGTLIDINKHLKKDEAARAEVNEKLKLLGDYEFQGTINVRHIAEFLAVEIGPYEIEDYLVRKIHGNVAIHYGCHFLKPPEVREIDDPENPVILEDFIEALGLKSLDFRDKLTCCGAGGGIKAAYAETSMTVFGAKMENIDEVKPDFILDICPFCHLQFETGQDYLNKNHETNYDYPVLHLSQITAYCMGMDEKFVGLQYQQMGKEYKLNSVEVESSE